MTNHSLPSKVSKGFYYARSMDGCDETWDLYGPDSDRPITCISFWDDGDGLAAARTEPFARMFAAAPALHDSLRELVDAANDLTNFPLSVPFFDAYQRANAVLAVVNRRAES